MTPETPAAMEMTEMKVLLRRSREAPVHCAIAQDGHTALLLMHRTKAPRAVLRELQSQFPDAQKPLWGSAQVNHDEDPRLVRFCVNKQVSGIGRKLIRTLKGSGYNKVRVTLEDGTTVEDAADDEDQASQAETPRAGATTTAASPAGGTPGAETGSATEAATAPARSAGQPHPAAATGPGQNSPAPSAGSATANAPNGAAPQDHGDVRALTARLTGLVRQLAEQGPLRVSVLKPMALNAREALKNNDVQAATAAIEDLEAALAAQPGAAHANAPHTHHAGHLPPQPATLQAGTPAAAPAPAALANAPAAADPRVDADPDKAPANPAAAAAPPAIARLTETLTELVRQMANLSPAHQQAIKPLAMDARNCLRSGDAPNAFNRIEAVQAMILAFSLHAHGAATPAAPTQAAAAPGNAPQAGPANAAPAAPQAAAAAGPAPANAPPATPPRAGNDQRSTLQRAQAAWTATRARVEQDIGHLHDAMQAAYRNHPFGGSLEQYFRSTIAPVMRRLDNALSHPLQAIAQNADPEGHAALLRAARDGISTCQSLIDQDPLIARLDANPFAPLAIRRTVSNTLSVLTRALA